MRSLRTVSSSTLPAVCRQLVVFACAAALALAGCGSGSNGEKDAKDKGGAPAGQAGGMPGTADSTQPVSPIALAVEKGSLKSLEGLLDEGAEVNAMDPVLARTALHSAGFFRREKSAELLIEKGAEVNAKDISGLTPLHAAVLGGNESVVALMLDKGADVNAATDDGSTPLHMAAAIGEYQIVKQLLAKGADRERLDKRGQPPRFYASRNRHDQTASLLQSVDSKGNDGNGVSKTDADPSDRKPGS